MATNQAYVPYDNTTLAAYKLWAQAIGTALAALGWVKTSDTGTVVWANIVIPTAAVIPSPATLTNRGTIADGTAYVGVTTNNGSNDFVQDSEGNSWICIANITTATPAVQPKLQPTNWRSYNFEIWRTNGASHAATPIYVKFVYWNSTTSTPRLNIAIGTGSNGSGSVSGLLFNTGGSPAEVNALGSDTVARGTTAFYESSFSGDADNLRMLLWRNSPSAAGPVMLVIDRAKDTVGSDLDTYVYVWMNYSNGTLKQQLMFKSKAGALQPPTPDTGPLWAMMPTTATYAYGGQVPVFLVHPLPGYVANPTSAVVLMKSGDFAEGMLVNVMLYGGSHPFLMTKNGIAGGATAAGLGIRFE